MDIVDFQAPSFKPDDLTWLGLRHLSATSIPMYIGCPNQFRFRSILGQKKRPGEALVIGTAVHSTLEWNFRQKIESHEDVSPAVLVEHFTDLGFPEGISKQEEDGEIEWDAGQDEARKRGQKMIEHYRHNVSERVQPIEVETEFRINGLAPIPVIGYPDVVTEHQVIDYKTAKQLRRVVKPDWQLQGRLYSLVQEKPVDFHVLAHTGTLTPLEEAGLTISPTDLGKAAIRKLIENAAARMESDYNLYGPNEHWPTYGTINEMYNKAICAWCGWNAVCPGSGL